MKPYKVFIGARVIHFDYLNEKITYNIDKKTWSCTCTGNAVYQVKCFHIKDCEECL